jgi:hypothetical protein
MGPRNVETTQPLLGRRRESRLRAKLQARLIGRDGTTRVMLADLSRRGARVDAPALAIRPGQDAVLEWDRFEAFGTVVWNDGAQIGLNFEEPLPSQILIVSRALEDARMLPAETQVLRDAARLFVQGRRKV